MSPERSHEAENLAHLKRGERGAGLLHNKGRGMNIHIKLGEGLPRPPESMRISRRAYLTSALRTSGLQINDVRSRLDTMDTIKLSSGSERPGLPMGRSKLKFIQQQSLRTSLPPTRAAKGSHSR